MENDGEDIKLGCMAIVVLGVGQGLSRFAVLADYVLRALRLSRSYRVPELNSKRKVAVNVRRLCHRLQQCFGQGRSEQSMFSRTMAWSSSNLSRKRVCMCCKAKYKTLTMFGTMQGGGVPHR